MTIQHRCLRVGALWAAGLVITLAGACSAKATSHHAVATPVAHTSSHSSAPRDTTFPAHHKVAVAIFIDGHYCTGYPQQLLDFSGRIDINDPFGTALGYGYPDGGKSFNNRSGPSCEYQSTITVPTDAVEYTLHTGLYNTTPASTPQRLMRVGWTMGQVFDYNAEGILVPAGN